MSEYELCLLNNNQDCLQNRYQFLLQGNVRGPLLESDCSSCTHVSIHLHESGLATVTFLY